MSLSGVAIVFLRAVQRQALLLVIELMNFTLKSLLLLRDDALVVGQKTSLGARRPISVQASAVMFAVSRVFSLSVIDWLRSSH